MSDFSEKCKYYIKQTNWTLYQIAKQSKLDRTTIQRMVSGERLPSFEFVDTFSKYLKISTCERIELLELFKIEKIGKASYQNRHYIRLFLEYLSDYDSGIFSRTFQQKENPSEIFEAHASESTTLLTAFIQQFFSSDENKYLYTNIPGNCESFFQILSLSISLCKKNIVIKHVLNIMPSIDKNIPNHNLEIIHNIVPLLFSGYDSYQPYYFYSKLSTGEFWLELFPYYLITASGMLQLSADLKYGLIHTDQNSIRAYKVCFEKLLAMSAPLVTKTTGSIQIEKQYCVTHEKYGMPFIPKESFSLPSNITIELMDGGCMNLQYTNPAGVATLFSFEEKEICEAFSDYFSAS